MAVKTSAMVAEVQCLGLKLLARAARPRRIPLVSPRCTVATGGRSIAGLYDEIFCRGGYESPTPLPVRARIVDAGGHLGMASLYFLTRYPTSHVTTIEANPSLIELLRQNLAPWGQRSELIAAALSTRAGTTSFHVTDANPLTVTGGIENRESPGCKVTRFEVPCVDANVVLAEPIDLMKLDVEGHEYELLKLELFRPGHVRNLIVEFHEVDAPAERFQHIVHLLVDQRGYRVADMRGTLLTRSELNALQGCVVLKLF